MNRLALLALFAVGCSTVAAKEAPLAVGAVEADLLETRGALSQAETQLEQLYAAASADGEANAQTAAQLQTAESSLSSAQAAYRSTQGQLARTQSEVDRLAAARAASDGQVDALTQHLAASEGQVDALTRDLAAARGNVASLSQALATAQASAGHLPRLQSTLAHLEDQLAAARRQEQASQVGLARLERENRQLLRDVRGLGPLRDQLQAAIADAGRLQTLSFDQGRRIDRLQARLASYRQQVRVGAHEQERLVAQSQALKGEKADLARDNRRLKAVNEQLAAKIRALESPAAAPAHQASAPAQRPQAGGPHGGNGQGQASPGDGQSRPGRGDRGGSERPARRVAMK